MIPTQEELLAELSVLHPSADCELNFQTPFELLIAVVLSAQCTDRRVNEVTKELFKVCNTPKGFVDMPTEELENKKGILCLTPSQSFTLSVSISLL